MESFLLFCFDCENWDSLFSVYVLSIIMNISITLLNIFYLSKSQHLCSGKKNVFIKLLDLKSIRRFIRRKFSNNNLFKFSFVQNKKRAVFFINNWIEMDQLHHWVNRLKILTEFLLARIPMNLTHLWKNSMKKEVS